MSDLMCDYVCNSEVAGGLEAVPQLLAESQIQIQPLIARAIKRPSRRSGGSTRRLHLVAEQDQRGILVGLSLVGKNFSPHILCVSQYDLHEFCLLVVGGFFFRCLLGRCRLSGKLGQLRSLSSSAQKSINQINDKTDDASASRDVSACDPA